MSGQILKFDDSAHREADAVLPWYVNGTLAETEREAVERHVRECARCRREIEVLEQLRAVCAADEPEPDATPSYRRLATRIGRGRRWDLLERWRRSLRRWAEVPPWARWAIAVQFTFMLGLAAWVAAPDGDGPRYRTLGAPGAGSGARGALTVVFAPATPEVEFQRILEAAGARIVDGPTASHAYVLRVPEGRRDAALAALRAEPSVVLAQPLTAQPDR